MAVHDGRIVAVQQACELGAAWFGDGRVPARSLVDGRDVGLDAALAAAATRVAAAARPLVYLAPDLSCEAQREGVALADTLRAALDSVTSATALGSILAAQERGRASATLGEIRHRADVLVFWGVDPARCYPRYTSRYAPDPVGMHVPGGRAGRFVIAVDVGDARAPGDADQRVALAPAEEVPALTALAAAMAGAAPAIPAPLQALAARLRGAAYAVIVADAETSAAGGASRAAALIALAQAVNGPARGALSVLRAGGNRSGADAVMTAQTGYPAAIDFARGYPRYRPHDGGAAARLARGEVDAAVILGAVERIPAGLRDLLARVPAVVIGPRASDSLFAAGSPVIDTGVAGIHDAGIALRMDDVPLPLRPVLDGPLPAAPTIRALVDRLTKADAVGSSPRRIVTERSRRASSAGTSPGSMRTTQR